MIRARGEIAHPKDQINLTVSFKDNTGTLVDPLVYPTISMVSPSNLVMFPPTSAGVGRISVGQYSYIYDVPLSPAFGVYNDVWSANINGNIVENKFSFIINYSQVPEAVNADGYIALGDDPGFDYSQNAITNINVLMKMLRQRLRSQGKSPSKDAFGNTIYVDCDIFSVETLVTFLAESLSLFNQTPFYTSFSYEDTLFVRQFSNILVEGALVYAMASQALIEKGRSYNITDNGISVTMPDMGDMLNSAASTLFSAHMEKLKYIKNSLRPSALGLGVFNMNSGAINPAIRRLRHLRQRRII